MNEAELQNVLNALAKKREISYPCDAEPMIVKATDVRIDKVVTATSQLRILNGETPEVWAPLLYQSSMNPEYKEIKTLTVERKEDKLYIRTRYGERVVEMENVYVEVSEWIPVIHKVDCRHCQNCGRCGW